METSPTHWAEWGPSFIETKQVQELEDGSMWEGQKKKRLKNKSTLSTYTSLDSCWVKWIFPSDLKPCPTQSFLLMVQWGESTLWAFFTTTAWHHTVWEHLSHPTCQRGMRRHAGSAEEAREQEQESISPLVSTEASINEQPGNVSIQTHFSPKCLRRPWQGHRQLGDVNNWGPCFKCLNKLRPGEEVLRDVQVGERELQQKYLHYVSDREAGRCSLSGVKLPSHVTSWVK